MAPGMSDVADLTFVDLVERARGDSPGAAQAWDRLDGIFSEIAGTQRPCTPGELLGSTTPTDCVRGAKLSADQLETENSTLRREFDYLRPQRDILKKTLGILSEAPTNAFNGSTR